MPYMKVAVWFGRKPGVNSFTEAAAALGNIFFNGLFNKIFTHSVIHI